MQSHINQLLENTINQRPKRTKANIEVFSNKVNSKKQTFVPQVMRSQDKYQIEVNPNILDQKKADSKLHTSLMSENSQYLKEKQAESHARPKTQMNLTKSSLNITMDKNKDILLSNLGITNTQKKIKPLNNQDSYSSYKLGGQNSALKVNDLSPF